MFAPACRAFDNRIAFLCRSARAGPNRRAVDARTFGGFTRISCPMDSNVASLLDIDSSFVEPAQFRFQHSSAFPVCLSKGTILISAQSKSRLKRQSDFRLL